MRERDHNYINMATKIGGGADCSIEDSNSDSETNRSRTIKPAVSMKIVSFPFIGVQSLR